MNDEEERTEAILERIPRRGFDCHTFGVPDLPDTRIFCEAIALGGQLVVHGAFAIRKTRRHQRLDARCPGTAPRHSFGR